MGTSLDRLIDALETHAPDCRVVVADASVTWPGKLLWPELVRHAAIVGPAQQLEASRDIVRSKLGPQLLGGAQILPILASNMTRDKLARMCLTAWAGESKTIN